MRCATGSPRCASIPQPGPYRSASRCVIASQGKLGTAGEFIDLPDVAHGAFALWASCARRTDAQGPAMATIAS